MRVLCITVCVALCLASAMAKSVRSEDELMRELAGLLEKKMQLRDAGSGQPSDQPSGQTSGQPIPDGPSGEGPSGEGPSGEGHSGEGPSGEGHSGRVPPPSDDLLFAIGREYLDIGVKCIIWYHQTIMGYISDIDQPTLSSVCPMLEGHMKKYASASEEEKEEMEEDFNRHAHIVYFAGACINVHATYDTLHSSNAISLPIAEQAYSDEAMELLYHCNMLFTSIQEDGKEVEKDTEAAEQNAGIGGAGRKRALNKMLIAASYAPANKRWKK